VHSDGFTALVHSEMQASHQCLFAYRQARARLPMRQSIGFIQRYGQMDRQGCALVGANEGATAQVEGASQKRRP